MAFADSVGGRAQEPAALVVGRAGPGGCCGARRRDRALYELRSRLASAARHPIGVGRVAPLEHLTARDRLAVDQV